MNAGICYPAETLAKASGLTCLDLYRAHPADMGSPGHFRMAGGSTVYTREGVLLLAQAFERNGWAGAGEELRRVIVASEAAAKHRAGRWYQEGVMA